MNSDFLQNMASQLFFMDDNMFTWRKTW
jgi:hypothetical protein